MGDGELSRSEVLASLEEARRTGIAISDEDFIAGFAAVGAPIFDHTGSACAALSISGARPAVLGEHEQHVRRLLVDGAREASRSLGHEAA
jgi:DNA-binding IclR family transcriptional regulator